MRVVLNTNVFLRFVLASGREGVAGAIYQLWKESAFQLVISEPLLEEFDATRRVPELAVRHGLSGEAIREYVSSVRTVAEVSQGTLCLDVPHSRSETTSRSWSPRWKAAPRASSRRTVTCWKSAPTKGSRSSIPWPSCAA